MGATVASKREQQTYTTAKGKTVEFLGVSPFEVDEVRQLVDIPAAPTRTVETAIAGYTEDEPLSEDDLRSDEERRIWAEYVKERDAAKAKQDRLVMDYILLEGIRFDMDDLEAWTAKRRRWGLPVPEDEREMMLAYVKTAVIGGVDDLNAITTGIFAMQGVDEATLKSVQATFQRSVRRETPGLTAAAESEVDVQPAHAGDESSPLVGGEATD